MAQVALPSPAHPTEPVREHPGRPCPGGRPGRQTHRAPHRARNCSQNRAVPAPLVTEGGAAVALAALSPRDTPRGQLAALTWGWSTEVRNRGGTGPKASSAAPRSAPVHYQGVQRTACKFWGLQLHQVKGIVNGLEKISVPLSACQVEPLDKFRACTTSRF